MAGIVLAKMETRGRGMRPRGGLPSGKGRSYWQADVYKAKQRNENDHKRRFTYVWADGCRCSVSTQILSSKQLQLTGHRVSGKDLLELRHLVGACAETFRRSDSCNCTRNGKFGGLEE